MSLADSTILLFAMLAFSFAIVVLMGFVFARLTGWTALSHRYPVSRAFQGPRHRLPGMLIGPWGWNGPPVFAGVDETGLWFFAARPFGLAFRPVHLPWSSMASVGRRAYMFFDVVEVALGDDPDVKIGLLASPFVESIWERLATR